MKFVMTSVPPEQRRWTVEIDGEKVSVGMVVFTHPNFGTVTYGLRPEGYDAWVVREPGGGGAATVPYARTPDGELLVALLRESRANMGDEPVWDLIGGFIDPGETHAEAQVREAEEETGLDTVRAHELPGLPAAANRAYWVADAKAGEGLHVWGIEVPFSHLEVDETFGGYKLKSSIGIEERKAAHVRFFPWREAVKCTPCALTRAAIAQLLADVF